MYTIGEFSMINKITTKTLRYYDRLGLLKPARVDDWTGYRYYTREQLGDIQEILHWKDLGFSLQEIQRIQNDRNSLPALLKQREQDIRRTLVEQQERLTRLNSYLTQIQRGEKMRKPVIKELPEVIVASMRTIVSGYDKYFDIVPQMGQYMDSVGARCRKPEYCFTIYHDGEYKESDIDVEICEAVLEAKSDSDKVKFKTIKGVKEAACLKHKGPYKTIGETYNRLFQWIHQQGYSVEGSPRESYIDGIWNKENPQDWLTEIQIPIGSEI